MNAPKQIYINIRIYPSPKQGCLLWKHANTLNFTQNFFLNVKLGNYQAHKQDKTIKQLTSFDLMKLIPKMKNGILVPPNANPDFAKTLSEIHSQVSQYTAERLQRSYNNFFRRVKQKSGPPGFPKFRSCKKFYGILYTQSGYKFSKTHFITKAYGSIPYAKLDRKFRGDFKTAQITCDDLGHWYVCVVTDAKPIHNSTANAVGIDVGLKNIAATSDGLVIPSQKHSYYFDRQIAKLQQKRSRLKKGSRRYRYLSGTIGKMYSAKSRKLRDFQHKVSKILASYYSTIFVEKLSTKKMLGSKKRSLNRAIQNAAMSQFLAMLKYKAVNFYEVDPYNTSKSCNNCGHIHEDLTLSQRQITCENCGMVSDRDVNAARNIFCLGQAVVDYNQQCAGGAPGGAAWKPANAGFPTLQKALANQNSPIVLTVGSRPLDNCGESPAFMQG